MILRSPLLRRGRQALSISRQCSLRQESSITTFDYNARNVPSPLHGGLSPPQSPHQPSLTANSQASPPPGSYYGQQMDAADVDLNAIAQGYRSRKQMDKRLLPVGSEVEKPPYRPQTLLANPPTPNEITLELLMAAQTHMGHATASWNPATSRYILGVRHGIHIISLEATAAHLRRACRVVEEMAYAAGLILFVGTRKGQAQIVARAADLAGACRLWTEWVPGTITNRDVLLAGAPVKAVNELDQPMDGFGKHVDKARPLMPDLVVCFNPLENYAMLQECGLANIPTVGVIDTDADPSHVTYSIPANDDSLRSIAVIAGALGHAGAAGLKRRLADAREGRVTWKTPWEIREYLREQEEAKEVAAAAATAAATEPSDARRA